MSQRLPCDMCLALGDTELISVTDDGCRHNTVDDAVLAYRAGTASEQAVLDAMVESDRKFNQKMIVEYITRTKEAE